MGVAAWPRRVLGLTVATIAATSARVAGPVHSVWPSAIDVPDAAVSQLGFMLDLDLTVAGHTTGESFLGRVLVAVTMLPASTRHDAGQAKMARLLEALRTLAQWAYTHHATVTWK